MSLALDHKFYATTSAGIALGSNLGNREKILQRAIQELRKIHIGPACSFLVSSFYETVPLHCPANSPLFLNAVLQLETTHAPLPILKLLQKLEIDSGRPTIRQKNAPRTLDLDLLYHGSSILVTPELELPHPRIHERLFVLEPLVEICPNLKLLTWNKTAKEYLLFIKK